MAEKFLNAFRRRISLKEKRDDCFLVLGRLEELIGWNFIKRFPPEDREDLQPLFDAFNDLIDSFHFFAELFVPSRIAYYAFRDPLTEVFNRHFLREQINFLKSRKEMFPIGIIYVDMDNLKLINDNFGHKFGDLYIKKLAEVLVSSIRGNDFVVRLGGDEFVIIVTKASEQILEKIANRIKNNIDRFNLNSGKFLPYPLSVSIGWSLWKSPEDPFERALEEADLKMYENKRKEKG